MATLYQIQKGVTAACDEIGGQPVTLGNLEDSVFRKYLNEVSRGEFEYELVLVKNGTSENSDDQLVLKVWPQQEDDISLFKNIVHEIHQKFNSKLTAETYDDPPFYFGEQVGAVTVCTEGEDFHPELNCFYLFNLTNKPGSYGYLSLFTTVPDYSGYWWSSTLINNYKSSLGEDYFTSLD